MKESIKVYVERFFLSMMESKFNGNVSFLEMPTNNSFRYCLKEILYVLDKKNSDVRIRDYTNQVYLNFYNFMMKDKILKNINDFEYKNLMLKLKNYSEGKIEDCVVQQKAYFERLIKKYSHSYKNKCYEILLNLYSSDENIDNDDLYNISLTFLNELLAYNMNYRFINFSLSMYKAGKFNNFPSYIKYLHYNDRDSMEIYIPIKNASNKDLKFLNKNNQETYKSDDQIYCRTYINKRIDFYSFIEKQIIRIESIFNTLRFYTTSKIDFDLDKTIEIHSTFFNDIIKLNFKEVISYSNKTLTIKNLDKLLKSLDKLKGDDELEDVIDDGDLDEIEDDNTLKKFKKRNNDELEQRKDLYFKILNILSFTEKDKDLLNHNSFVDNWTALESLCGLQLIKSGYEAVRYIVPKIIVSKIILKDINDIFFKNAHGEKIPLKAKDFIDEVKNGNFDFGNVADPYLNYRIKRYAKIVTSINNFKNNLYKVEKQIEYDLMRIYMIRNEYAHESNLNIFNSMQQYKLKTILPLVLDEFFRTLNNIVDYNSSSEGLAFDVFNDLLLKYEMRENIFLLMDKGCKINNGGYDLKIVLDNYKLTESELIFNILKNNADITKKVDTL